MMKLQTLTLGCSKNKVDTEHILSQVESSYEIIPEGEDVSVDVLLINTCGFIGDAKEESVQAILEAVERKKQGSVGSVITDGRSEYGVRCKDGVIYFESLQLAGKKRMTIKELLLGWRDASQVSFV